MSSLTSLEPQFLSSKRVGHLDNVHDEWRDAQSFHVYPFGLWGLASLGPISRTLRKETLLSDVQPFADTMSP